MAGTVETVPPVAEFAASGDPIEINDTEILPIMDEILACLCGALDSSPAGAPCFCGLVPGDRPAYDYCQCTDGADCGMAWVRLDASTEASSVYNSVYARTALQTQRCVTILTHRLEIGTLRCVPISADGEPMSMQEQAEATRIQLGDYAAIRRALDCCFSLPRRREWLFERYFPIGPQGGCVGGYVNMQFRVV